ncbi:unnamed protein product [Rotaria sp. Silwood2]|nr:unnamed protein product [Rotaria sp. Silwood2]CAF2665901.1 unnamed protein product [Rotaria sp. Silwood2]CAF3095770.1 unnamed protein product [Rotaria sp. Silwood2]CAF4009295.1 unnamed protein product [Rotaria sp. Silwood2]CAF4443678.1 unnamed protein product [Rotaria sp. Silwood2]
MELKQIHFFKYKHFQSLEKEGYIFDLARPLTTLVGSNSSGKTTLLEILRIFFTAVKYGSKCCSLEDTESLLGINFTRLTHRLDDIWLQGVFDVPYRIETKTMKNLSLRLNVSIKIECDNTPSNDIEDDEESKTPRVHIRILVPSENTTFEPVETTEDECPQTTKHISLYQDHYGILGNLFPTALLFNSKTVANGNFKSLYEQYSDIDEHQEELSKEIQHIFPFIELTKTEDSHSDQVENKEEQAQNDQKHQTENPYTLRVSAWRSVSNPPKYLSSYSSESSLNKLYESTTFGDVTSAGERVLQCLYIITTICCIKRNTIILIDELDAHVFASAQKLLINFFDRKLEKFRELNSFCQMVIITHSPEVMQAVKLKDIRQIHLDSQERIIIATKSLECSSQLLNVMTDIGATIFDHSELVKLCRYGKLLYLENHDDYEFLRGIINQVKPELLNVPFTPKAKGGRTATYQIKELISELRQLVPKKRTLHISVLVDADLRLKTSRKKRNKITMDYKKIKV